MLQASSYRTLALLLLFPMKKTWIKYALLFTFFGFLLFSLDFYFKIHKNINHKLLPIQKCLHVIQQESTSSHLWLEQHLVHDKNISINEQILEPMDTAEKYALAIIHGNLIVDGFYIIPMNDSTYIHHSSHILKYIFEIKETTQQRLRDTSTYHVNGELGLTYDSIFLELSSHIKALNKHLGANIQQESTKHQHTQNGLVFFSFVLGFLVLVVLLITDQIKAKALKIAKDQRFEMAQILNEAPIGIIHFDKNFAVTDCNPKFQEIIGAPYDQIIGFNMAQQVTNNSFIEAVLQTYINGSGRFEGLYKSVLSGKETPIIADFKALKDPSGKYYSGIGLLRDVTNEYKAKQEIKDSEEKFRSISEMANDMIIMMNNKGQIEFWNKQAEKTLGFSKEEAIGNNLHDLIAPNEFHEAHQKTMPHWIKTGSGDAIGKTLELKAKCKNGKEIIIALSLSSINIDGQWNAIGIIRDITASKKYEEELIVAKEKAEESDRLKSAFLSNISHEIRTPMNGIIGFSDLLKDPNISGDQLTYFIDIIETSSKRMLNIINDIIIISKIEAGDITTYKEKINIQEELKELTYSLIKDAEDKNINLTFVSELNIPDLHIFSDYEKIKHIYLNILNNSIKFTHAGSVSCTLKDKDQSIVIEIRDTGIGISQEMRSKVFDHFRQVDSSNNRAYEGAGLGLSISKNYIEVLGGNIEIESTPGEGSCFTVTLPIGDQALSKKKETAKMDVSNGKLVILIAEDEYPSFVLLNEYLSFLDATIIHAEDGVQALSYVKNNKVDLILMDLKMPNMDGYTCIPLIKSMNPEIPIIAQTAFAMSGDEEKAIEIGSDDYIRKPIDERVLKIKIQRHLSK